MMNDFIVVFSAEFVRRLKSRAFQIGALIGVIGILSFTQLPRLFAGVFNDAGTKIAIAGDPALTKAAKPLLADDFSIAVVETRTTPPDLRDMKARDLSSWVILERAPKAGLHFTLYSRDPKEDTALTIAHDLRALNISLATGLTGARSQSLLDVRYDVRGVASKFASTGAAGAAWGISYGLLMLLYMLIFINGQLVLSSVAEEKTSRIAELLIASISPIPLLYGKIAAATATGLLQMTLWIGIGALVGGHLSASTAAASGGGFGTGNGLAGAITPIEMLAFVVLFALGFLQYSMLFAGIGSLINRTEDLGNITFPVVLPVIAGLVLAMVALGTPDAPLVVATSFVPLLSPFVLFARIAMSNVPLWQIVLGIGINVIAAWIAAMVAGKLYRVGMLLYGRPPSLKQVWSVIRS